MKILQEAIRKLTITEVERLDPISVYLEDFGAGQGKITITCFDESWTAYWGGMGNRTISEFVRSCDNHYLAKNLSKIPSEINDPTHLCQDMLKNILSKRKALELNETDAREYFDNIKFYSDHSDSEGIMNEHGLLTVCYGDEWWYCLPKKPNPDYEYLCRIITAAASFKASFSMKEHDVVKFKGDFEFEAIDSDDNPIGMRTIPKDTKCTIVSDTGLSKGWVIVEFKDETWDKDWGVNDLLEIPVNELEVA